MLDELIGEDIQDLKRLVRGELIFQSDEKAYSEAVKCFNHDSKMSPLLIVQVRGALDVQLGLCCRWTAYV